jgi:ABC-type Fe3+-citrate transport system substrate-binding protein
MDINTITALGSVAVGGVISTVGIYIKMRINNAVSEQAINYLTNDVKELKQRQENHENKMEGYMKELNDKISKLLVSVSRSTNGHV